MSRLEYVYDVDLAAIGALLGNASRGAMLDALLAGRALTATELGRVARVSPSTASEHLNKLCQGGLVEVVVRGRYRYHRLSSSEVAAALESLSHIAPAKPVTGLRQSRRARSLADARICYDHLAGRCGVALHDGLLTRGWLVPTTVGLSLSDRGTEGMLGWGVDVAAARRERRPLTRICLDWTERRHHLAGSLAAALTHTFIDGPDPWFNRRADDHRGLRPTDLGRARLAELGWKPAERSA